MIPFIQARNFTRAGRTKIDLIVIHTMEAPEGARTAENVAQWFAGSSAPQASAHYCVDAAKVVQCVLDSDVAWHAPGANRNGIGIEHAGYASQSAGDWADPYSTAMLQLSAGLVSDLCVKYLIPMLFVDADGLKAGCRGITTHKAVTDAFNGGKGHWDPGPNFPMDQFLEWVRHAPVPPAMEVDDKGFVKVGDWWVAPTQVGPMGIDEAAKYAAANGCELPTPELVDAIWKAADLKIEPHPRSFTAWTQPEMDAPAVNVAQSAFIAGEIAGRKYTLLAGAYKDVVSVDGKLGLYGWHHVNGTVIQTPYFLHAGSWRDYSQGVRLVRHI